MYRGDSFREEYSKLGQLYSIIHRVHFLALTATASRGTHERIFRSACMLHPKIIYVTPQKKNLMLKNELLEDLVKALASALTDLGKNMPRVIQYDQCSLMYRMFKYHLGPHFTIPSSATDLSKYRLVDMYTRYSQLVQYSR